MRLILLRHGNIFEAGEKHVRSGIRGDRPLTEAGVRQAVSFAENIKKKDILPKAIYTGTTKKNTLTAENVATVLGMRKDSTIVDKRIDDLDYGSWEGLTDDDIITKFGKEILDDWEKKALVPHSCGFYSKENIIAYNLRSFCAGMLTKFKKDTVIMVVSDGIVKFFYKLFQESIDQSIIGSDKITIEMGHCSSLHLRSLNTVVLDSWDINPSELN